MSTTEQADAILAAMTRMWVQPAHRKSMAQKFAVDRNILPLERVYSMFPMQISQIMADQGWTEEGFVRALY